MKKTIFAGAFALFLMVAFSSVSRAQGTAFMWVRNNSDVIPAGYKKVEGGLLKDGTVLYVCRAFIPEGWVVPGKFFNKMCLVPWHGTEVQRKFDFDMLVSNVRPQHWKQVHDLSKAQIKSNGVFASSGQAETGNQYVCRKKMSDGIHPGKYAIGNGLCYVSWGGKETSSGDDFEILWHD